MATAPTVERQRRQFVPDEAWLAQQVREPILEPDLPIVDPHHHLWNHANHRYLLGRDTRRLVALQVLTLGGRHPLQYP